MFKLIPALMLALIMIAGCGQQPSEDGSATAADTTASQAVQAADEEYLLPQADEYITISDSIGIELGDSNYVFGQIVGLGITPKGNIAVLDMQKHCVSIFNPAGEFIQRIGRQGSGPGEFQLPVAMAFFPDPGDTNLPDSLVPGLAVCDAMGGKLVYFDRNYNYMTDVQGFFPSPPANLRGVDGNAIVGMKPEFEQNDQGMFMGFTIGRWEMGETEPSVVYFHSMSPFDPSDLSSMQNDIVSFGADAQGFVLTAPLSTDSYTFTLWSPDSQEVFTYEDQDFQKVPKTQSEIDLEREVVNSRMVQQGMPESMANWEPDPYRPAIAGLWFDDLDRIWVTKGTTRSPSFDVYDKEGNFLFSVAVDAGERAMTWQAYIFGDKFLAFDTDPDYYPQVFIGNLPGFDNVGEEGEGL